VSSKDEARVLAAKTTRTVELADARSEGAGEHELDDAKDAAQ
jgi:hypothetical protein